MADVDEKNGVETGEANKQEDKEFNLFRYLLKNIFAFLFLNGLAQLFAFLGDGADDNFLGGGISILQSVALLAIVIQIIVFIPCYIFSTEKFYDLTGSLTYLSCTLYALFAGSDAFENNFSDRAVLVSVLTILWCLRLGGFLFYRVLKVGKDERFDKIKVDFFVFLNVWVLQGVWVFLTAYPVFIVNADQDVERPDLVATDFVGLTIWIFGFIVEVVSDFQKIRWRGFKNKKHDFIDYGLWKYSRHPNYFGEMTLWLGMFIISIEVLDGKQFAAIFSPVFVFCLIYFVSGVPQLEKRSDEKFKDQDAYWEYKRNTSVLVLLPYGWGGNKKAGPEQME